MRRRMRVLTIGCRHGSVGRHNSQGWRVPSARDSSRRSLSGLGWGRSTVPRVCGRHASLCTSWVASGLLLGGWHALLVAQAVGGEDATKGAAEE